MVDVDGVGEVGPQIQAGRVVDLFGGLHNTESSMRRGGHITLKSEK